MATTAGGAPWSGGTLPRGLVGPLWPGTAPDGEGLAVAWGHLAWGDGTRSEPLACGGEMFNDALVVLRFACDAAILRQDSSDQWYRQVGSESP